MTKKDITIKPTKHGPYKVTNIKNLKNSKEEALGTQEEMYLCRCGGSKNKPYCDGTHSRIGLADNKEQDRVQDKLDRYNGRYITIHNNKGVCSHRGHCTDNLPSVFNSKRKPWIDPDAVKTDEIARMIKKCPSGALSYTKDGVLHKEQDRKPGIIVSKDGPYDIVGGPILQDPYGSKPESKEHYTLCRCGHSKNKPFCNGQHWYVKFKDPKN